MHKHCIWELFLSKKPFLQDKIKIKTKLVYFLGTDADHNPLFTKITKTICIIKFIIEKKINYFTYLPIPSLTCTVADR